jgi:hypothetical protein
MQRRPYSLNVVVLRGRTLHGRQPDFKLNPKRGTMFQLADYAGITIEFKRDAAGKVTEAVLNQPGPVVVLKKK